MRRQRPIFSADQDHIHHKLLRAGLSHRQAVLSMYVLAGVLAGVALLLRAMNDVTSGLLLLMVAVILFVFLRLLAARNPDIEGIGDPFAPEDGGLPRSTIRELAERIRDAPNGPAVADVLGEAAVATGVVALSITGPETVVFAWSQPFSPREVVRGMKTYRIGLEGAHHRADLVIQFKDKGRRGDLTTVIPWELLAWPIAERLDDLEWRPLRTSFPTETADLRRFLAIPGIAFSDAPRPHR